MFRETHPLLIKKQRQELEYMEVHVHNSALNRLEAKWQDLDHGILKEV